VYRDGVNRSGRSTFVAILIGALGALGFLFRAAQRPPLIVLVLMAGWVLAPFVILVFLQALSASWRSLTRTTLYVVIWVVTLGTLAVYADDARGHRRPQAAFVFVLVPPVSSLLMAVSLATAALIARSRGSR